MGFMAHQHAPEVVRQADSRSTFQRRLYRRRRRPSCVLRLLRFARCGAISSIPMAARTLSRGSLSYALSPISRSGCSGVKVAARVWGPTVTACGVAAAVWTATERPVRSATAMSFVPLPHLVAPHAWAPLFATTNVPSMKHALRSSSPRSRRSAARASRTHCWKRR
jgi:hypothetical protein